MDKFKLWKLQKRFMVDNRLPMTLPFYQALMSAFGKTPINALEEFVAFSNTYTIALYTTDLYELRMLLKALYEAMIENKSINHIPRLHESTLENVEEKTFRKYLNIVEQQDVSRQKNALLECMELTLQCISLTQTREKDQKYMSPYYNNRVLSLCTDFADIYYALIIFYLET